MIKLLVAPATSGWEVRRPLCTSVCLSVLPGARRIGKDRTSILLALVTAQLTEDSVSDVMLVYSQCRT